MGQAAISIEIEHDEESGELAFGVAMQSQGAEQEWSEHVIHIPLGRATVEEISGAIQLSVTGVDPNARTGGDPFVSIRVAQAGDHDGDGVVTEDDLLLADTLEKMRLSTTHYGAKAPGGSVAESGKIAEDQPIGGSDTWRHLLHPEPLELMQPGTFDALEIVVRLHLQSWTDARILGALRLRKR